MDTDLHEIFLRLVRLGVGRTDGTEATDFPQLRAEEWVALLELSEKMGMAAIVLDGLNLLPASTYSIPKQVKLQWIGQSMMLEGQAKEQWKQTLRLVDLYAEQGLVTVGLKGMTVAQWWPNPMQRYSCDFDCFLINDNVNDNLNLNEENSKLYTLHSELTPWERGNQIVEEQGIEVDRRIYVHSIFNFEGLTVENHHYLAAVKLGKRYRKLDATLRSLLMEEPLQAVMGSRLMMGGPMFNALFLTHHAHRHALGELLPLKLVMDWVLFIKNNASLDWDRYWRLVDEFGMLRFAQAMTRAAVRMINDNDNENRLPLTAYGLQAVEDREADEVLEECIWDLPEVACGGKSLFARRLSIIGKLIHSRRRYKVFYDKSALGMIVAYVKGYFFGE